VLVGVDISVAPQFVAQALKARARCARGFVRSLGWDDLRERGSPLRPLMLSAPANSGVSTALSADASLVEFANGRERGGVVVAQVMQRRSRADAAR